MSKSGVSHPIFARCYALLTRFEGHAAGEHRLELVAGLRGRVIEVGAGNGMNFRHYPARTEQVVAVEPEPHLRRRAVQAAREAPVPITVRAGLAERLPLGDGEFDAAVVSLVLCTVPDAATALAELRRVLKPGGELRFYEHVGAEARGKARVQAAFDRSGVWPFLAGGCHCSRDTVTAIRAGGFAIERVQPLEVPPAWAITNPLMLGVARATSY